MGNVDVRNHRLPADVYQDNFSDIKPAFSPYQAHTEASRCLYCDGAPCISACPTGIDIPSFINRIASENYDGAAQVILEENILGGSCARVCPTEILCEEACVRNREPECTPVMIGRLQRFAIDNRNNTCHPFVRAEETGKTVAVVGAGPAGLACAHRLARQGHVVTVFDAKSKPGGLNEYGIAAYKLVDDYAQQEIDFILEVGGIHFESDCKVGKDISLEDLRIQFDAVFLGVGLGAARELGVAGESPESVQEALHRIASIRQAQDLAQLSIGARIVVIGGGNTAIDIACQIQRLGAEEVTIAYRRGVESMSATGHEQAFARNNGVRILPWLRPVGFEVADGEVQGVRFVKTMKSHDGKLLDTDEQTVLPADRVYKAIGQVLPADSFAVGGQPELCSGKIVVDRRFKTSLNNVWAGGDCVDKGEDLTVYAVEHGKRAALAIDEYLQQVQV